MTLYELLINEFDILLLLEYQYNNHQLLLLLQLFYYFYSLKQHNHISGLLHKNLISHTRVGVYIIEIYLSFVILSTRHPKNFVYCVRIVSGHPKSVVHSNELRCSIVSQTYGSNYEAYRNADEKLSTLLREISWSNNLTILSRTKSEEERSFYLQLCVKERLSYRDLNRQIDSALFERTMMEKPKLSPLLDI